jgi:hypothetical protein
MLRPDGHRRGRRFLTACKRCGVALLAALTFAACDTEPESYASAKQVVGAMADAGLACTDFKAGGSAPTAEAESLTEESGTCSIEGEDVVVATFGSPADRDDWVAVGRLLGPVAMGPNWIATSRSKETVTEIVDALDAARPAEGT